MDVFIAAIELSSGDNAKAYKCNDGTWSSCTTEYDASSQPFPWIMLVFKRPIHISQVVIILPTTNTPERLKSFTVRASNHRPKAGNETAKFEGSTNCLIEIGNNTVFRRYQLWEVLRYSYQPGVHTDRV